MSDTANNPPKGDFNKAEKYINQLVNLLNQNKVEVFHTDLKKFDPGALQDHYTITLKDYQIEISHSKQPNSGKDSYVMLFNNLKNLSEGNSNKVILAYVFLADSQFAKFKIVADRQIAERKRAEEEKQFDQALDPIDELLDQASGNSLGWEPKEFNTSKSASEEKPSDSYTQPSQVHQI